MRVFVLIFNSRTDNEGIHTIRIGNRNQVLMFESEDDAIRFGLMLEAQDFPSASVEALDEEEIKEFCQSADYDCRLIGLGELTIPPETNVDSTDWTPEKKASEFSESELDRIKRKLEGLL